MSFAAQSRQATRRIDGADFRAHGLQRRQGAALGFDLAGHVLAQAGAQVGGGADEPFATLVDQVGGHALGLLEEVGFVGAGFVEAGDCFVDFVAADGGAGFEAVGGGEFGAGGGLCLEELSEEDVAVRKAFFDDEGVGGVVLEGLGKGCGFGGPLYGVEVTGGLHGFAESAVGVLQPWVAFVVGHCTELVTEIGFCETECCEVSADVQVVSFALAFSCFDQLLELLASIH